MADENPLNQLESELKGSMPDECIQALKKFTLCKVTHDEELKKTIGLKGMLDYSTDPFTHIDGCKNEYHNYNKCYSDFYKRWVDLKNYVAIIEGKPLPFNKKEMNLNKF
jgi:hypothetical protein